MAELIAAVPAVTFPHTGALAAVCVLSQLRHLLSDFVCDSGLVHFASAERRAVAQGQWRSPSEGQYQRSDLHAAHAHRAHIDHLHARRGRSHPHRDARGQSHARSRRPPVITRMDSGYKEMHWDGETPPRLPPCSHAFTVVPFCVPMRWLGWADVLWSATVPAGCGGREARRRDDGGTDWSASVRHRIRCHEQIPKREALKAQPGGLGRDGCSRLHACLDWRVH